MDAVKKEEKILYLECSSGISGDMTVGALLDLGASRERLEQALSSLGIGGYALHFGRTKKCGIDAFDFDVELTQPEGGHSHSHGHDEGCGHDHGHGEECGHSHSHGHDEGCGHDHGHGEECGHDHGHGEGHGHSHGQDHAHRNLQDIFAILDRLDAAQEVRGMARDMFTLVAEAESQAHGIPIGEVHFHEVGAIDSIIDIIGAAFCLHDLGISRVAVSPLSEGRGYVRCQHGVMPVPAPATANIAARCGLTLRLTENEGEMVTPTGAAIAAVFRTERELPAQYRIERIGLGAGKKDFPNANLLRAMILIPEKDPKEKEKLWVLESNLDDCSGEAFGFAMETLFEAGALDVWYTPAYMKKNRPAYQIHVLCGEEKREELEAVLFSCTTTIGIRRYPVERTALDREEKLVKTRYGAARVKLCHLSGGSRVYPEYESVRAICRETGLGFLEVYHAVLEDGTAECAPGQAGARADRG